MPRRPRSSEVSNFRLPGPKLPGVSQLPGTQGASDDKTIGCEWSVRHFFGARSRQTGEIRRLDELKRAQANNFLKPCHMPPNGHYEGTWSFIDRVRRPMRYRGTAASASFPVRNSSSSKAPDRNRTFSSHSCMTARAAPPAFLPPATDRKRKPTARRTEPLRPE